MTFAKVTKQVWIGRVLSGLAGLNLVVSGVMKFVQPAPVLEGIVKLQIPQHLICTIGVIELVCVVIYLIPKTAVLGAILLTGYLGGAVLTHVRVGDPFISPIIVGIIVWLGLYLREPRLRALIPVQKKSN